MPTRNLGRSKRGIPKETGVFYNFKIGENNTKGFHIKIKVPNTVTFPYNATINPIRFFLPDFSREILEFKDSRKIFVVTEGRRCRYKCSRKTKKCQTSVCWNRPSACFGDLAKCLNYDSDGGCRNTAKFKRRPTRKNKKSYELSSIDFRKPLHIPSQKLIIDSQGNANITPEPSYYWKCILEGSLKVNCFTTFILAGPSITTLKSLTGYKG